MKKIIPPETKFSAIVDILSGNMTQSDAALHYNISHGYLSILCSKALRSIHQIVGTNNETLEQEQIASFESESIDMERQQIRTELIKLQQRLTYLKSKF